MKREKRKIAVAILDYAIVFMVVAFVSYVWILPRLTTSTSEPQPFEFELSEVALTTADGPVVPNRVIIPSIGVYADVEHVGRAADGAMAVPVDFNNTGWFREGFVPGENGMAVLAGHLDDAMGNASVFYNLDDLEIGDAVLVSGEEGVLEFRVVGKEHFDHNLQDTSPVFGPSEKPMLNLITCDGVWLSGERTYDKRLVVFTELVR